MLTARAGWAELPLGALRAEGQQLSQAVGVAAPLVFRLLVVAWLAAALLARQLERHRHTVTAVDWLVLPRKLRGVGVTRAARLLGSIL